MVRNRPGRPYVGKVHTSLTIDISVHNLLREMGHKNISGVLSEQLLHIIRWPTPEIREVIEKKLQIEQEIRILEQRSKELETRFDQLSTNYIKKHKAEVEKLEKGAELAQSYKEAGFGA